MRYLRGDGSEIFVDDLVSELTSGENVEVVFGEGRIQILVYMKGDAELPSYFEVEGVMLTSPTSALQVASKLARRDDRIASLEAEISGLNSEIERLDGVLDRIQDELPVDLSELLLDE